MKQRYIFPTVLNLLTACLCILNKGLNYNLQPLKNQLLI